MENIVMKNENYKLIKISDTKYEIFDLESNEFIMGMEGENITKERLQEALDGCHKGCIFI